LAGGAYYAVFSEVAELDRGRYSSAGSLTAMPFEQEALSGDDSATTFTLTKESQLFCIAPRWAEVHTNISHTAK